MTEDPHAETVLDFWFGRLSGDTDFPSDRGELWWGGNAEIDADIRRRFGALVRQALDGGLTDWANAPRGRLALIILLDQFQRSLGRGTAKAFAGDPRALGLCMEGIDLGHDLSLRPVERSFFYMPLMHAEDPSAARRCLRVFETLAHEIERLQIDGHPDFLSHAKMHADIVLRFGRFPHRNEALGRVASPEELEFLADGGPTFGQKKE